MQVGKGLKRATGRDEWDQHHRRDSYICAALLCGGWVLVWECGNRSRVAGQHKSRSAIRILGAAGLQ